MKTMDQSKKSGGYKFTLNLKSIQIMLPISVLSFLFSQSPILDGLLNLLYTYGCSGSIRAERTYAFLLFNGLLALLIKNAGGLKRYSDSNSSPKTAKPAYSGDSSGHKTETTVRKDEEDDDDIVPDVIEILADDDDEEEEDDDIVPDVIEILADDEEEEEEDDDRCDDNDILADDEEEDDDRCDDNDILADDEEDEDDRCDDNDILADDEEDEETEEVVEGVISVEELNRKCDDFIKNMRHLL